MKIGKERERKEGRGSPPQAGRGTDLHICSAGQVLLHTQLHWFHRKRSKMTICAIFCFLELNLILRKRQGGGYYASRRDNAMSVLSWFQFLVLVSLFPHDDRELEVHSGPGSRGVEAGARGEGGRGEEKEEDTLCP